MKITPTIDDVVPELESWAAEYGWKTVGVRVSEHYHRVRAGDLLPVVETETDIRNASQRLRRIFRGDGHYREMAEELLPIVLEVMPAKRRLKLTEPESVNLLTAKAVEDIGAALSALLVRCPAVSGKLARALTSLQALIPVVDQLMVV